MKLRHDPGAHVRKEISFSCRCGGTGHAGYVDHKDGEQNVPAVFHSIPHCAEFERLTPNDYLYYVRTGNAHAPN